MSNKSILTKGELESILSEVRHHVSNCNLISVLFMNTKSGERVVCQLSDLPSTPEEKRQYFMSIGASFRQNGTVVQEVIFACESWYVKVVNSSPIDVLPSEHPERQEAVVLVGRNADNTHSAYLIQPFTRNEDGGPVWQPVMFNIDKQVATGLLDWFFAGQQFEALSEQD